jgi:cytochrome c553
MRGVRRVLARGAILAMLSALCVSAQCGAAGAGNVKAGREKAEKCAVCHGLDGMAKIAEAPNLAGQNENYLVKQLGAFKDGERKNEMMSIVITDLTPTEIEDLAAYYSAIEITVGKIPGG